MIIFCEVADPLSFWVKYWQCMSEDISHHLQSIFNLQHYYIPKERIKEQTLPAIDLIFNASETSVSKFNLPSLSSEARTSSVERLLLEELDYNISSLKREHETLFMQLNFEQRDVYDKVLFSFLLSIPSNWKLCY